ncbi:MAG: hypothetical protein V1820_02720 [archaeon]
MAKDFVVVTGIGEFSLLTDLLETPGRENLDLKYSARVSTGLLGLATCPAGNASYAPKGMPDVLIADGPEGVAGLVALGFIPCPVCKPEEQADFWPAVGELVGEKYPGIASPKDFADKEKVPYDVRETALKAIVLRTGAFPNRLYLPRDLSEQEILQLAARLGDIQDLVLAGSGKSIHLPQVGCYDRDAPGHFREYELPKLRSDI